MMRWFRAWVVALALAAAAACGGGSSSPSPNPAPTPGPTPIPSPVPQSAVLVGAGDIGMCGSAGPERTATLLDKVDGIVFTAGDNAYFQGTAAQFAQCYDPSWGRHKDRTFPAPGNHEYETAGATAYFNYFGERAGTPGLGYYSFTAGAWHVVSLNSNVPATDGSPQMQWLRSDLTATRARCVAAIWHHPLFSSGRNGPSPVMRDVWRALRELGADVVIVGHDHLYERFARQDETGRATSEGLRQFTVGTGGAELTDVVRSTANSERVMANVYGVLKLTLTADAYSWQYIVAPPSTFTDTGSDTCR
jgi:hypothetical protein